MPDALIADPILNSPYEEPTKHFRFTEDGITNEEVHERRLSSYFVPVPRPKKRKAQLILDSEWTADRIEENEFINRIRERVARWRKGGYRDVTPVTRRLLEYWTTPGREKRFFYCQIEALETAIYLTEVAGKVGDAWIENALRDANEVANPGLYRVAFKMATGTGKTVVMAMLVAFATRGHPEVLKETPDQMVRRVCRALGTKRQVVVLNDEAHHCYRHNPDGKEERLKGDVRREAKERDLTFGTRLGGWIYCRARGGVRTAHHAPRAHEPGPGAKGG